MRKILCSSLGLFLLISAAPAFSRDINLDALYLKDSTLPYKRLQLLKKELYRRAGSSFIDDHVAFARFTGTHSVVYVKEKTKDSAEVYLRNPFQRKPSFLTSIDGVITTVRMTYDANYCIMKRIVVKGGLPSGDTMAVKIDGGEQRVLWKGYPFLDFSIYPAGSWILRYRSGNIYRIHPRLSREVKIEPLPSQVSHQRNNQLLPVFSPALAQRLYLSGSGGSYRGLLKNEGKGRSYTFTSAEETAWLNKSTLVYRAGGSGDFTVYLRDVEKGQSRRLSGSSYNTGMMVSQKAQVVTFLENQAIQYYDHRTNSVFTLGLEGEDAMVSNDRRYMVSLFDGVLYFTDLRKLARNWNRLHELHRDILVQYKNCSRNRDLWKNGAAGRYLQGKIHYYETLLAGGKKRFIW